MMNLELKELINSLVELVENICTANGLDRKHGEVARLELGMFMMYLSAADGEISWDEASTISNYCDLNLTPSSLGNFIRENNIYSTEFEQKVPLTLQLIVATENILFEQGSIVGPVGSDAIIGAFKAVGESLIKADNNIDDNEKTDFELYIRNLELYREKNSASLKNLTTGFSKEGDSSTNATSRGGVRAPRKG